jgi:acetylornithine deacetylase/succinyl-diaminopimelate desuccinylase-like protein
MPSAALDFARQNQARFLAELKGLLRIPSISTLPEHNGDTRRAAETLATEMRRIGLEKVQLIETAHGGKAGHPLVYGEWLHAAGKPTVLCYGHYDVQPPDPLDEWLTPPFEPTERNGNLYARGAVDDKGQMYMHLKALESLFETGSGKLPLNVRVILEGEEEVGGEGIANFVREHPEELKADFALVSDTERHDLHRDRGEGREDGSALWDVWWRGAESVCGAGADPCRAEGPRGKDFDTGLL